MAEHADLSTPTQIQAFYPAPGTIDVASQREAMTSIVIPKIVATLRPQLPLESSYRVMDETIIVEDGAITVRCIQPLARDGEGDSFPLLVWLHGGGWCLAGFHFACPDDGRVGAGWISGDLDLDDFYLRIISVELRLCIVNVDYRLAPEHPFPIGLNDCYAALKWSANNALKLGAYLSKGFLIGGASGGAHFAAVLAHRARDDPFFNGRTLTGQIIQIPSLLHPERQLPTTELLSLEQNKDAPIVGRASLDFFFNCLQAKPSDPEASPLLLSHENLPAAYMQVAGLDPLRDEGLLYARLLREHGMKTKLDVYPGVPHAFHASFPQLSISRKWEADIRAGIMWLLPDAQSSS
ncbi:alpha/beta hydrolase fold-domain-containing protein [Mycena leptocephala]|nr:alpha/beta hydrolase fold-domain-containing protein [Mycena leptocephala]